MQLPLAQPGMFATLPEQDGEPDQLVFRYEPPTPEDHADLSAQLLAQLAGADFRSEPAEGDETPEMQVRRLVAALQPAEAGRIARFFCDVFNQCIRSIDNLIIGDVPFDRNAEGHLRSIPAKWKTAIGRQIYARLSNPLSDAEQGN